MKKFIPFLVLIATAAIFLLPHFVFAGTTPAEFQPIVPVPGLTDQGDISFPDYINRIFQLSVIIGSMLAVVMFIYGGFEYMTGSKSGDKKNGLERIRGAVMGLVLLLSVYLVLHVINPCILEITVFSNSNSPCSPHTPDAPAQSSQTQTAADHPQATGPDFNPVTNTWTLQNGSIGYSIPASQCPAGVQKVCVTLNDTTHYSPSVNGSCDTVKSEGNDTFLRDFCPNPSH